MRLAATEKGLAERTARFIKAELKRAGHYLCRIGKASRGAWVEGKR